MSDLLKYIENTNKEFSNKIINAIKDDENWLKNIGLLENGLDERKTSDFIRMYISNPANIDKIDQLLKYIITEYLSDDDETPLIKHSISADDYGRDSALFVFKCSDLFFCYYIGENSEKLITKEPESFCLRIAKSIIDYYKMEEENLADNDWFSDSFNDLRLNFNFEKI
jgi:hypothetical protein